MEQLINNTASWRGGTIDVRNESLLLIINCALCGNTALQGGAIGGSDIVRLEISSTQLNNNKAFKRGGTIFILKEVQLLIKNCTLHGYTAGYHGGAMYVRNVKLRIDQCIFTRNALSRSYSENGCDVSVREYSSLEVRYTLIFV